VSGGLGKSWNGGHVVEHRRREGGGADGVGFEDPSPMGRRLCCAPSSFFIYLEWCVLRAIS